GTGSAGFGCTGGQQGCRADVPKPAADPGRGEPPWRCGPFPGPAQGGDEGSGQPKLGVRGDDPARSIGRRRPGFGSSARSSRGSASTAGRCVPGRSDAGRPATSG